MRITFILPGYLSYPSGGYKVVYEYANHLCARGHQVTLVHPRKLAPAADLAQWAKAHLWPYRLKWRDGQLIPWFQLNDEATVSLVPDLREQFIPPGDAIIATAFRTAFCVAGYEADKGRKYYLIQHHEIWDGDEAEVNQSWVLPLHKIVIAKWLLQLAHDFGEMERVTYIPNGLDFSHFRITTPIAGRLRLRVGMMAHSFAWKGTADGIAALNIVKEKFPELQAVCFGVHPQPSEMPAWMEYRQQPTATALQSLYNSCAIFLHPSWTEGWGLPAAEAMACGCALVATHNRGVAEFATDGENALLTPPRQPEALAQSLLRFIEDDILRQQLAAAGRASVQQFTWEKAVSALEKVLVA